MQPIIMGVGALLVAIGAILPDEKDEKTPEKTPTKEPIKAPAVEKKEDA